MSDFSLLSPGNMATMSKALPGEPAFIILGRDPDGGNSVRGWADRRAAAGDQEHADLVYPIADAMDDWAKTHRPETGPLAYRYEETDSFRNRLRADIVAIQSIKSRTGYKKDVPLRWEGTAINPNGYRRLGDMAGDVEMLLNLTRGQPTPEHIEECNDMLELLADCLAWITDPSEGYDVEAYQNLVIRIEEKVDGSRPPHQRLRGDSSQLDGEPPQAARTE